LEKDTGHNQPDAPNRRLLQANYQNDVVRREPGSRKFVSMLAFILVSVAADVRRLTLFLVRKLGVI